MLLCRQGQSIRSCRHRAGDKQQSTGLLQYIFESPRKHKKKETVSYCLLLFKSEWGDSNSRHPEPKPMSEPSCRPVAPSLTLSGTPAVPLWNSFALFVSGTAFVFWDLCGMKFCILKVLPTRFSPGREWSWLQKSAHKLRRINNEISAGVTLPTLSINGKCVVVAKTPSENVQTKKKLAHFL